MGVRGVFQGPKVYGAYHAAWYYGASKFELKACTESPSLSPNASTYWLYTEGRAMFASFLYGRRYS